MNQTYTKVRLKFDIPIPFYFLVLHRVTMERGDIAYTLQINVKKELSKFCVCCQVNLLLESAIS